MKTLVVLLLMLTVTSISEQAGAQDNSARKPKSVAVTFDSVQASARRPLTQAERLRRDATLRSNRRLQAGYNQQIPF